MSSTWRAPPWLHIAVALSATHGCATVVIEDDDGDDDDETLTTGSGTEAAGGPGSCLGCTAGNCGLCEAELGDRGMMCRGSHEPPGQGTCSQSGSVYEDAMGLYTCWRCPER